MRLISLALVFTSLTTTACTTAARGGYGPQGNAFELGSAYGYKETKIGEKTWFLQYADTDMFKAVQGFDRRAHELCATIGFSQYKPSSAPGLVDESHGSVTAPVFGGATYTSSSGLPSQSAYVTCE